MSKKKLFWLYVAYASKLADEFGECNEEFWEEMKQDAKDAKIKWDDKLANMHWSWIKENLK